MQIEKAIIQALKGVGMPSNIIPVLSDRTDTEPPAPYLLITIIDVSTVGLPRRTVYHRGADRVESIFQVKDYRVSFTFHASVKDDTHDWVQHFHTGMFSDMVDYAFSQQGLGIVNCDTITYQSQPVSGVNYKRANMDMTIRAEVLDSFTVNNIDRVKVIGEIVDSFGSFVEVETLSREYAQRFNEPLSDLVNQQIPKVFVEDNIGKNNGRD